MLCPVLISVLVLYFVISQKIPPLPLFFSYKQQQIEPTILSDDVGTRLPVNYTDNLQYVGYGELYLDILREQTQIDTSTTVSVADQRSNIFVNVR